MPSEKLQFTANLLMKMVALPVIEINEPQRKMTSPSVPIDAVLNAFNFASLRLPGANQLFCVASTDDFLFQNERSGRENCDNT